MDETEIAAAIGAERWAQLNSLLTEAAAVLQEHEVEFDLHWNVRVASPGVPIAGRVTIQGAVEGIGPAVEQLTTVLCAHKCLIPIDAEQTSDIEGHVQYRQEVLLP